jgi:hypothetical protein
MSHRTALPLLLGTAFLVTSCSSGGSAGPTTPTTFGAASSVSITAQALAPAAAVAPLGCPTVTPFVVPLIVTVTPTGPVTVVVTSITTQFTSFVGAPMPPVTLPAPVPTVQYGSALEQARNPQTFSFNVCRAVPRGMVAVTVNMQGMSSRTVSVAVD